MSFRWHFDSHFTISGPTLADFLPHVGQFGFTSVTIDQHFVQKWIQKTNDFFRDFSFVFFVDMLMQFSSPCGPRRHLLAHGWTTGRLFWCTKLQKKQDTPTCLGVSCFLWFSGPLFEAGDELRSTFLGGSRQWEKWKNGKMEKWKMKNWKIGKWKNKKMEKWKKWKIGKMEMDAVIVYGTVPLRCV